MTTENTVDVVIRAKNEYSRELASAREDVRALGRVGGEAGTQFAGGMREAQREVGALGRFMQGVGQQIISTAAGFLVRDIIVGSWQRLRDTVVGSVRDMIDVNREWEIYEARYYVQLGRNHEAAARRMAEIREFALGTPFEIGEIIEADMLLQTFGLHSEQAARRFGRSGEDIRRIAGDVAAGTRASFEEMSMWIGRFAVGDTGQAIRRFQELGVVTREELRGMGVEFDQAGAMTTPVEEAMVALLALMDEKFGGLMEIESDTLLAMQSNLRDFMTMQRREWGEPVFDAYKDGIQGLMSFLNLEGVQELLGIGSDLFAAGVGWLRDMVVEWAGWFGELIARAANWGANIVESIAGGIAGSDAITRSLRSIATDLTYWLAPGSPPRLLPDLTRWGMGTAEAWLEGWSGANRLVEPYLRDMIRSLQPYLEQIEAGEDPDMEGLREAFGPGITDVEDYVWAFQRLSAATSEVAAAREELAEAEEEGDEDRITAAQERLEVAEDEERQAQITMTAEQQRITQRAQQETMLARAMEQQTAAVQERTQIEARAAEDAAARAAEAEQRAIAQAYLQYRLAVAGTPLAQIPIWEEELARAEAQSAEWWQIQTRLVQLRRQAAETSGASIGASYAEGFFDTMHDGMSDAVEDAGDETEATGERINWGGIGQAIGGALIEGLTQRIMSIPQDLAALSERALEWAGSTETQMSIEGVGVRIATFLVEGMKMLIRSAMGMDDVGDSAVGALARTIANLQLSFTEIGRAIGTGVIAGLLMYVTDEETAWHIGRSVMSALVRAGSYLTPMGQFLWLRGLGIEAAGNIGEWIGEGLRDTQFGQGLREWNEGIDADALMPEWMRREGLGSPIQESQTIVEEGAVQINIYDPREGEARDEVLGALGAVGITP